MQKVANLANFLTQNARQFPDRPAIIFGERRWSWTDFKSRVDALAAGLHGELGLRKGDRLVVHATNSNQVLETIWACFTIGVICVPSNYRSMPKDLEWMIEMSQASCLVCDGIAEEHAAVDGATLSHRLLIGDESSTYESLVTRHMGVEMTPLVMEYDAPAWLFSTSGTTGKPKGSTLTHGQLAFVINNHIADLMPGLTEMDVSLVIAPLSHGAGMHSLTQAARGAASVIPAVSSFDPAEAWRLVEAHGVTNTFTVPTILKMLVEHDAVSRHDHSSLRQVIYAGAPMYHADQLKALEELGSVLVQYYGLGEVTGCITYLRSDLHGQGGKVGTCGLPRTGMQIEIQNQSGDALPVGDTGEICVVGPGVFAGYWDNPAANEKSFRNGWFCTGDIGHMDTDGYLYLTGRESEMYISGGSNISPREIEEEILHHPAVKEVCVFGVPDPKWGETGIAIIALHDGQALEGEDIRAFLKGRIIGYKIPSRVDVWGELPKSATGKIVKKDIRGRFLDETGADS